jgi:predicted transcriptional regulator
MQLLAFCYTHKNKHVNIVPFLMIECERVIYECENCHLLFTLKSDKEEHKKQTGHLIYDEHRLIHERRRRFLDEIFRILKSAIGGVTKTHLMYKAYIPYEKLSQYLNLLLLSGFIEYDRLDSVFRTTEKGITFLNTLKQLHKLSLRD